MRFTKVVPFLGAALAFGATSLSAQGTCTVVTSCTVTNTASATVNNIARLTLDMNSTDLGTPTETDFLAGYRDAAGPTATVLSNAPWHVSVVGNTPDFSAVGTGSRANKPAADLLWGTVSGTYGNNAGAPATLFSGNGTAGSSQAAFYRTNWNLTLDTPGTYTLVVNYTLSEP
ncbi:MAG TPA: hypothetical protein VGL65_11080 [Gemmatimonadales bacterium]|jgi:hypothetical protein